MYEGYQVKGQQIEYPIIEKNRYHLFYKGIINVKIPPLSMENNNLCSLWNKRKLSFVD